MSSNRTKPTLSLIIGQKITLKCHFWIHCFLVLLTTILSFVQKSKASFYVELQTNSFHLLLVMTVLNCSFQTLWTISKFKIVDFENIQTYNFSLLQLCKLGYLANLNIFKFFKIKFHSNRTVSTVHILQRLFVLMFAHYKNTYL